MTDQNTDLPTPEPIPTEDWMPVPVSDSADYLDREPPKYIREEQPDAPTPAS